MVEKIKVGNMKMGDFSRFVENLAQPVHVEVEPDGTIYLVKGD
jgi:hypothetical protein